MKTAEEKAEEFTKNRKNVVGLPVNDLWIFEEGFVEGYIEATRWRDPKEELPTTGEPVIVKYTTARGVEKYGIGRYFELGIGNPWTIEGSTGREVIGWRPIE